MRTSRARRTRFLGLQFRRAIGAASSAGGSEDGIVNRRKKERGFQDLTPLVLFSILAFLLAIVIPNGAHFAQRHGYSQLLGGVVSGILVCVAFAAVVAGLYWKSARRDAQELTQPPPPLDPDLRALLSHGRALVARRDPEALRMFLNTVKFPASATGPRGVDPNVGSLLISIHIALGEFDQAEQLLRPMRLHPQLKPLVELAEREMAERKREVGMTGKEEFDGYAVWVVKGSKPERFVIALRNSKLAGDQIFKRTDPMSEPQTRTMLKQMGLSGVDIEQTLLQACKHPG